MVGTGAGWRGDITRMSDGKAALLERMFVRHRGALEAFFQRRIRRAPDAADLAQEVYLRLLRVKDTDAIHNPEGYLYTVASHLVREQILLTQRQGRPADLEDQDVQAELAGACTFEEFLDGEIRAERLQAVLAQLSPKCRAVVAMKYNHGMSYEEIARQLGISKHMVQKYLGQALAHCRRRMTRLR